MRVEKKILLLACGGLFLTACLILAFGQRRGSSSSLTSQNTQQTEHPRRVSEAGSKTITVPKGGNFQKALDAAAPGDTIILEASASFIGPFTLPAKASTSSAFITIQSSALASLPASRVSPQHASLMPKLLSPGNNLPALLTAPSAHH
ncbi:MAG TPA: hypothetical protein VGX92_18280, partial [Pyrinomonadaceae bacterium]|nr:hypothetical protein [Pyrinomonadaceae bacterium]